MNRVRLWLATIGVAIAALPVAAQVQTGSILVRVTDQQGGAVPGVTITLSSPVLVAGTMTGVTDTGGVNRFPSLQPGVYSVKLELQGFRTVIRENVLVVVGQTVPLDLSLSVATVAETVTVTGTSPVVDTTTANTSVNLSEQLLQATPGGRDIWSLVEYKVPSLLITRPDVGGTSGGLQGVFNARGTTSGQNSSYLNGINVGDPAAIGAAGFYYDFDAFEDIQVSTGAHDISVPTGGVFLNMVTKSGGENWRGRATAAWLGDATQTQNIDSELLRYGFRPETNSVDFVSDANFSAGGPILARKLRIFTSFRDWRVHVNVPAAFSTLVLDSTDITSGLINANYQLNDSNRLTGLYSRQYYKKPRRFLTASNLTVLESTNNEDDVFDIYQVLLNSVVTQKFFIDARVGLNRIFFPTYLNGNDQTLLDSATNIRTRNGTTGTERWRDRYQMNTTGQYYLDEALGGRHEFKFGIDFSHMPVENRVSRFDDVDLTYSSATGLSQNVTLYGTPFYSKTALDLLALYAQDSISWNRLTVTGGLRWENLWGYLPEQSSPPSRFFPNLNRTWPKVEDVVNWTTVGPRISFAYDVMGNGRTGLKFAAGRYYYMIPAGGGILDTINPNGNYQETYGWNDLNGDRRFQPGEQTGSPVITTPRPDLVSVDPNYARPYTDEFTGGVDHELLPNLRLSVIGTHRVEKDQLATSNPANPYDTFLTTRVDTGRDGIAGTADDGTFQFYNRTSTAVNRTHFTNDPTARQTYNGIEITGTKRMSNRWQMLMGYTYSRSRIVGLSVNTNPNSLINVTGPLAGQANVNGANFNGQIGDRPHQFKLTGTYVLPWYDIGVAANLNSQSGIVITRQVSVAQTVGGTSTVNVEPLGSYRLPSRTAADLRFFKTTYFGSRSLEVAVDLHNVSNANTVWDARTLSGTINLRQDGNPTGAINTVPQFGSPAQVYGPRNIRFNVAFRF
ncbi:MAG TPA: TonB-dependent receptor [Vicinamibacterales bacterium]|nr:TonB-dependent receptor [Vicinamibacterales bacterium]